MRPDVSNEISWGDLDERIGFPRCNVFQVHEPKHFIFWDQRINVIPFSENCREIPIKLYRTRALKSLNGNICLKNGV